MAKLSYYYGSMNAGKSLQLLAFAAKLRNKDIPYEVVKPSTDTRDGSFISSRPLDEKLQCYLWRPDVSTLEEILPPSKMETTKYVLVDEAQFLTVGQVDYLAYLVDRLNINVVCYGLRTDFQIHLFEGSKRLFEMADELHEIEDIDANGDKVIINARLKGDQVVIAGPQVEIGAEDKYLSMSRKEFYKRLRTREDGTEFRPVLKNREKINEQISEKSEKVEDTRDGDSVEEKPVDELKQDYILESLAVPFGEMSTNDRFYTKESYQFAGQDVFEDFRKRVAAGEVYGTIEQQNHPVEMEDYSHQVIDAVMRPDGILVRLKVLDTPKGKLLKQIIDAGMIPYIAQRAFGSVDSTNMSHIDNLVGYDVVAHTAFPQRGKPVDVRKVYDVDELGDYLLNKLQKTGSCFV